MTKIELEFYETMIRSMRALVEELHSTNAMIESNFKSLVNEVKLLRSENNE